MIHGAPKNPSALSRQPSVLCDGIRCFSILRKIPCDLSSLSPFMVSQAVPKARHWQWPSLHLRLKGWSWNQARTWVWAMVMAGTSFYVLKRLNCAKANRNAALFGMRLLFDMWMMAAGSVSGYVRARACSSCIAYFYRGITGIIHTIFACQIL